MKRSYSKLLTSMIALSAFFFACSAVGSDTVHFSETILNGTNEAIYIRPGNHFRVHHPSRFKVKIAPFGITSIHFSVEINNVVPWAPYIKQHISISLSHPGRHAKCFQVRFLTPVGNSAKSKIDNCGEKNDMFTIHKHGSGTDYTIYINRKIAKLPKK